MSKDKATHQKTKQHNRDLVLKTIFNQQPISRAEIARVTKLTRVTVSDMVNICLAEGLVEEVGFGTSLGGKSPILLSVVPDSRYIIGLNLGQDKFIGSIVNLLGEMKETIEIPINHSDKQHALQYVYQILNQLMSKKWNPIVGIGVATPGLVNTQEGIIVDAVNLEWQDFPLAHLLEEHYHLPVRVLNDSQAAAIGEFVYGGNHRSDGNLVVVNVRHGIGAGILINDQLFQGDGGSAGEIGHLMVQENGYLCRCGRRGCLETVSSAKAVVQRVQENLNEYPSSDLAHHPGPLSLDLIQKAYQDKDPLAVKVVNAAADYLGFSLANLVGTLNIHKIVITGEMVQFGEMWLDEIRKSMQQACLLRVALDTIIEIGKLDFRGYILGASAFLLLNDYSLLFIKFEE